MWFQCHRGFQGGTPYHDPSAFFCVGGIRASIKAMLPEDLHCSPAETTAAGVRPCALSCSPHTLYSPPKNRPENRPEGPSGPFTLPKALDVREGRGSAA